MAYTKQDWASKTVVTKTGLINMDNQIGQNEADITEFKNGSKKVGKAINADKVPWSGVDNKPSIITDLGLATASKAGIVKPDDTTIKVIDGVISADDTLLNRNGYGEISGGKNLAKNVIYDDVGQWKVPVYLAEKFLFKKGVTYCISFDTPNTGSAVFFPPYGKTSQAYKEVTLNGNRRSLIVTMTDDVYTTSILTNPKTVNTGIISNLMIEEGSVATSYEPYFSSNRELTKSEQEIVDLKVLGWTVPKELGITNYVDSDRKFHQRVGRVDMSNVAWNLYNDVFYASIDAKASRTATYRGSKSILYATDYVALNASSSMSCNNLEMYEYSHDVNSKRVVIKNTAYSSVSDFQNGSKGKYLYYELATPIIHNIDGNEITTLGAVGDVWNSSVTYKVGDFCIWNNALWKCLVQHTGQMPVDGSTYWEKTSVDAEIAKIAKILYPLGEEYVNSIPLTNFTSRLTHRFGSSTLPSMFPSQNMFGIWELLPINPTEAVVYLHTTYPVSQFYKGFIRNGAITWYKTTMTAN